MIDVIIPIAIAAVLFLGVEVVRWVFRPAARRQRMLKKIGNQQ